MQSNLIIRSFLVTAKLFLEVKCSLLPNVHYQYYKYHMIQGINSFQIWHRIPKKCLFQLEILPNEKSRKIGTYLQSIISLVPKCFLHNAWITNFRGFFQCKIQKLVQKIPFFANLELFLTHCVVKGGGRYQRKSKHNRFSFSPMCLIRSNKDTLGARQK